MSDKELVERLLDFDKVTVGDARDAALRIKALTAVSAPDLETCGKCMGSGYGGHPDSGALCSDCNGTGGVSALEATQEPTP
jgi:DnaJ-class molecular chaperone